MSATAPDAQDRRDLAVLTIVNATPEKRGGAIRAGLRLGDHLARIVDADTVKPAGEYDALLADELDVAGEIHTAPARTLIRDIAATVWSTDTNYENMFVWSEFSTPRPLGAYDVVHLHNPLPLAGFVAASIRCRFAGVPYVVTTHGVSKVPEIPDQLGLSKGEALAFNSVALTAYKHVLRHASHLITLSAADKARVSDLVPGSTASVIPNGVSPPDPRDCGGEEALSLHVDRPVLLFVGKIRDSKGVADLLDAYQALSRECTLLVAGPPDNPELVERLRQADDDGVRYLGYTDRRELRALYRRADLFVFPTRSDVFPLVTLEAMAAGTPVVASAVGGIPQQLTTETGIVVPPERPGEVAAAVDELLRDPARRESMGQAARARAVTEFSWDAVARDTVAIYEQVLE